MVLRQLSWQVCHQIAPADLARLQELAQLKPDGAAAMYFQAIQKLLSGAVGVLNAQDWLQMGAKAWVDLLADKSGLALAAGATQEVKPAMERRTTRKRAAEDAAGMHDDEKME